MITTFASDEAPATGYWDMAFLEEILAGIKDNGRDIFIIPGAYNGKYIEDINIQLGKSEKVMVFVTSDEERKFPTAELKHKNMVLYTQYGNGGNFLPLGYTPKTRPALHDIGLLEKDKKWFFSGQITHARRKMMAEVLSKLDGGLFNGTNGFAQGMKPWEYYSNTAGAWSVVCPPGAVVQDSFRVYEALEAGTIPIVDRYSSMGNGDYWEKLFPNAPFPILESYDQLPALIDKCQDLHYTNKVWAWWIAEKNFIKRKILSEAEFKNDNISVVIPTSPIKSHPSTEIIEKVIKSVRHHLNSDIFITFDGVRPEQEHMRENYEKYIRELLWKCNFKYKNVVPIIFDEHKHQSGMIREVLKYIQTPLLLYVEHDTPLVTDRFIDFKYLRNVILRGEANVVRFHYEDRICPEHEYLMIGKPEDYLLRTVQWSQRPHLARTGFYRNIMKFFSENAKCFIEDLIYGKLYNRWLENGMDEWKKWRTFIYYPDGGIKRSDNLDGREGEAKFDSTQIW